jgi:riboflavin kinase / FMN adenylyltransferase
MKVVHGYRDVPEDARGAALAIGNFDGVHRGHQALVREAIAQAKKAGTLSGVLLFEPHPREFFHPEEPHFRLTPLAEKLEIFEELGVDLAIVLTFDAALANLPAQEFVTEVLVAGLDVRHVVIGHDFYFGKGRAGTPETLREAAEAENFGITVVDAVAEDGEAFSSSGVRLRLAQGDVEGAARILGRWWRVRGPVVGGAKRGTGLGFPTANVPLPRGTGLGHGIYAVRTYIEGDSYDSAAYLGTRPTYDDGMPVLEVFLFGFDGDLYGKEIVVEFIGFVRPDRKFDASEALIAQMQRDCARAESLLHGAPKSPRTT